MLSPQVGVDRMYWVQTLTRIADPVLVNPQSGHVEKEYAV